MKPEIKKVWIKALTGGKYRQGKESLRTPTGSMCCLGVLCDLYDKELVKKGKPSGWKKDESGNWSYRGCVEYPPSSVVKWSGLKDNVGELPDGENYFTLADANDEGNRFKTIAKLIAKHF